MAELRPHYIDVDLKKNTQYNVPVVTQNDTATHFIIRVTDDGLTDPELLDAYQEITMTSQRPDGESFYLTGTRIPGTNEIEFHLGTDETAFSGSVLASLQFYLVEDASRYTSAQFRYDVKKDLTKNYTPTQREETLVEVVLRDGPDAIREAKDAKIAVDGALVDLEQDKTAAIGRLDEVTEENKTVFRQPVATFAALSTTYPNPEHGTTVRVTSEAASYRYSDGSWVKTDEYNPTAIDQVTAQLADTAKETDTLKADKADKSYVVSELSNAVKKDETGVLNLNVFDESTRAVIQGLEPGEINAVLGFRNVKSDNIADDAINAKQVSFMKKSSNLFNKNDVTENHSISSSSGELTASPGNNVSDFIPVYPNTIYTSYLVARKAFYDKDKAFIFSNTIDGTYTTPSDAYFVRNVVGTINLDVATLNKGETQLPYEPFYEEVKLDSLPILPGEKLQDGSVNIDKVDFIKMGTNNLFNKGKIIPNKQLTNDGSLLDDPAFSVSEVIPVTPSTDYTAKDISRYNFIREDGTVHASYVATGERTFKTGISTRFIQFAVRNSDIDTAQINQGSTLLKYEPYTVEIHGVKMMNPKTDQGTGLKYVIDGELDGLYHAPEMESKADGTADPLFTKTVSAMYGHYDALLAAYPSYITRTLLGNEATGLPIYRYDFKPPQPGDFIVDMPKIMITTGTHGSEKASTWTAYQFFRLMCEQWASEPMLDYMRWNVHFIIIPIVNPHGYNAYTRQNSNGVDLNRNFPEYWVSSEPGTTTYGGTEPLSELEAQYIDAELKKEKGVIYFCDFHNFTTPPTNNLFVWNPASADYNAKLSGVLISKLTRKWKKEQSYLPQDDTFFGYSTIFRSATIAQHAYRRYGIESSTFEICERFLLEQPESKSFSALTFEMGVDAFVNWLAIVIKNNIELLNHA